MNNSISTSNFSNYLPVELWEKIFFHLLNILIDANKDNKDNKDENAESQLRVQSKAFIVINGTNRYLRFCTRRIVTHYIINLPLFSIDTASSNGNIELLNWWLEKSGFTGKSLCEKYSNAAVHDAAGNNRVEVLSWWKRSGLPKKYGSEILEIVTQNGNVDVLEWWKNNRLPFRFRKSPMDLAQRMGRWDMVKWWLYESNEPVTFTFPVSMLESHFQWAKQPLS